MWRNSNSCALLLRMQNVTATVDKSMVVPQKSKIKLSYDPELPPLGIHTKLKAGSQRDICTPMFTEALFTIAEMQKQPKFQLTNEWIKMWYL